MTGIRRQNLEELKWCIVFRVSLVSVLGSCALGAVFVHTARLSKVVALMRVDAWRAAFYYCSDSHISTPNDFQQNSVSPFPTLRASVSRRERGLEFNVAESLAAHSLHAGSSCIMFVCKVLLRSQEV